jgi:hypothetical protein
MDSTGLPLAPASSTSNVLGPITLTSLAPEILLAIVEYVGAFPVETTVVTERRVTAPQCLLYLALTCRKLHSIVEPILYAHFETSDGTRSKEKLAKFMVTILARPDLAQRVRILHTWWHCDVREDFNYEPEDWTRVEAATHDVLPSRENQPKYYHGFCDFAEELAEDIASGYWDAIITLIVSRLPNLEVLNFEGWFNKDDRRPPTVTFPIIMGAIERARDLQKRSELSSPLAMSNLRHITIKHSKPKEEGIQIHWLFPFFNIPSVRSFEVGGIEDDKRNDFPPGLYNAWDRDSYHVFKAEKLVLNRAALDNGTLLNFLHLFPNLEYLHYSHNSEIADGYRIPFSHQDFFKAIMHLKPCLKHLALLHEGWVTPVNNFANWEIVSLKDFHQLETLDIHVTLLFTEYPGGGYAKCESMRLHLAKSIPPKLESLTLREIWSGYASQLLKVMYQRNTLLPALKRLVLVESPYGGFRKEDAEVLLGQCKEAGIELVVK